MTHSLELIDFEKWSDFMNYLDKHFRSSRGLIYRGQADAAWNVESTLLRQVKKYYTHAIPDASPNEIQTLAGRESNRYGGQIMQSFRLHLGQTTSGPFQNEDEWLLGRHNGLFSPILDWSRSPYVAAFFAAADVVMNPSSNRSGQFGIWSLSSQLFEVHRTIHRSTDSRKTIKEFDAAKLGNQRGIAQQGVGTFIYPDTDIQSLASEVEGDPLANGSLRCFRLPVLEAASAIDHLYLMNIHFRSLYPDNMGLALQANMNLHHIGYEGMGGWAFPPGYENLLP